MRQRDVSGAQLVDGPEGGEAAVQTVPALDPDQARDQTLLQSVFDACKFYGDIKGDMLDCLLEGASPVLR